MDKHSLSTREAAHMLGLRTWQIRRLYESRLLPEPGRIGIARAIPRDALPAIREACKKRGWIQELEVCSQ